MGSAFRKLRGSDPFGGVESGGVACRGRGKNWTLKEDAVGVTS